MPENQQQNYGRQAVRIIGLTAVAVGCLVLLGWGFEAEFLKRVVPGLPRMSASAALCFALAGLSLLVAAGLGTAPKWARTSGAVALAIVFSMSLLRFSEHIFKWDTEIERSFWQFFGLDTPTCFGRMAATTAVGFVLTSVGLLLIQRRQCCYPVALGLLAITIVSLGMATLISYAAAFSSNVGSPTMAIHTAGLFVLLGSGLLAEAWRESGQMWFVSRKLTTAFVATGVLILSVSMVGYRITSDQSQENARLSQQIEAQTNRKGWTGAQQVQLSLSRETMAELRHLLLAAVWAGLGLFGGVLWLLNREVSERRTAETTLRLTERKAAEALRESEERFRQMAENIESVFWMSNAEVTQFLYVSPACQKVWGKSQSEVYAQGACFVEQLHPEDRERVLAQLGQKQFIQKAGFELEYRVSKPDGSVRWIRHRAFPISTDADELKRLVGTAEDITERKEAEEAMHVSQERLRSVWERSADGMRLTDGQGRIIAVNEAYCRLIKLPREQLEGEVFSVVYLGQGPNDGIDTYIRRFENSDIVARLSPRVQLWNAEYLDLEISNSFLELGSRGRLLLSIFRDVGERRGLEDQLRQAQKMEAIGRLAGGVAHDFNNLLVVMRTHAELLLLDEAPPGQDAREGLEQIIGAADKAANLTRQLLAFSRKQVMQSQPLLLNDIVANLTKMLNRIIGEDIRLQCQYAGGLPLVQADPGMLEQVLVNLVVNARDAMPQGGQVEIGTEKVALDADYQQTNPEARAGEFVCLRVADTGTGIAPEHLPRIFEPFFTTKEMGKGTGLGLATVYGIVKQHEGWIEVATRLGAGTTFRCFLPALAAQTQVKDRPQTPARICRGNEKILLVEDEDSVRAVIRESLETHGYTIVEANCARQALSLWKNSRDGIDLLLTDIVMPDGINGRDLADHIRASRPDLSVIFMSGYSPEIAGKDTGFFRRSKTAFLQKPFPATTLLETVRRCVDERNQTMSC